ncbi:uncharacterized protein LOC102608724 isoform X2 [Citrus sinensis]|uniref:uncharacterized protein LOC102608724 isoform X2 n=1 Tax=Citrus sinensis TaxID=2711 RepID=UPI002277674A|nr:uncharacterized protein LOC102608724 isoform X2 [Citrus sinensis]
MDKSWMLMDRTSIEYESGVNEFLKFAILHASNPELLRCPCQACGNLVFHVPAEIRNHLYWKGIDQSYQTWTWHGEGASSRRPSNVKASFDGSRQDNEAADTVEIVNDAFDTGNGDPKSFETLLKDAEKPLFPGCVKFTKLSALIRLYNIKGRNGWSNKSFSDLPSCLSDMLPGKNEIPLSVYEAKKIMVALGLEYEKIHACPNDCILYRKEYKDLSACPTCGMSRWKSPKKSKGIPAKILWYFPPIPRFKRMFQSPLTAKDLIWHANERVIDGKLRHSADSPSWRLVDQKWPDFAAEERNLQLAISTDEINPHKNFHSSYSCWPIVMITYNLPPWLCMKRKFMMLTMLISGPRQPGNDIDVYFSPLIDDLKTLWKVGVQIYDAYGQELFTLRAVLLWTISDFPAYGNLSGCSVKGYFACPICGEDTQSCRLKNGKKNVYMRHRRYLPKSHLFRDLTKAFDGKPERDFPSKPLSGEETLRKVEGIQNSRGKKTRKRKKLDSDEKICWKKKSIFFSLEYWKHLHVRHMLDVMHIEKNVCESIYGTLLNIPGKAKDGLNSRLDLVDFNIRKELEPVVEGNHTYLPTACYSLTRVEKVMFCETLFNLKVPEGYYSNFKNLVSMSDLKLIGLKSHDCHALMQQLLPLAIRGMLPKPVRYAITRLCFFFNDLCSKVVDVEKLNQIQKDLVVTINLFEMYFLPEFFDIMVHLTVHLVREVRLCGPVYLRWMYPFERFLKYLKGYVRNKNRPEGCIAECYIVEEAIEFCTEYLPNVDPIGIPIARTNNIEIEGLLPGGRLIDIDRDEWKQAHHYVLRNTQAVQPYIDGVTLIAETEQIASAKDKNPIFGEMPYYGVIKEIWVLDYHMIQIPIFKCDWVESHSGVKVDELGTILVDLNRIGHKSDRFILASQAKQVFYVTDQLDPRWSVVRFTAEKVYMHPQRDMDLGHNVELHPFPKMMPNLENFEKGEKDSKNYKRGDGEKIWIHNKTITKA